MGSGVEGEPVGNYLIFISLGSHGVAGGQRPLLTGISYISDTPA